MTFQSLSTKIDQILLEKENLNAKHQKLSSYRPRVAILVPYRDRIRNLKQFLYYMHQYLAWQQDKIQYKIYLIEPTKNLKFNRGLLLNIGYVESLKDSEEAKWDCFIFHDVDLLPTSLNNLYSCNNDMPKQMAISISKYSYK